MSEWAFISNRGLVLATIAKHPNLTAREIGDTIGVTERTAHRIIMDLDIPYRCLWGKISWR